MVKEEKPFLRKCLTAESAYEQHIRAYKLLNAYSNEKYTQKSFLY